MTASLKTRLFTIALLGNPNTGKSTLFNALCGMRQRTGNYPGVTVERKEGQMTVDDRSFAVIDLPGTYSLAPRSPDEMIAVDVLLGRQRGVSPPDAVLLIVDASNLERNFYLVSQVLELGRPTVIAVNMMDVAANRGITLDLAKLSERLGVPVVPVQANRKHGLADLKIALAAAVHSSYQPPDSPFPELFRQEVNRLDEFARRDDRDELPRYLVERLLLDTTGYLEHAHLPGVTTEFLAEVQAARGRLAAAGIPVPGVEAISRYRWVAEILAEVVTRPVERRVTVSDKIDRLLTHRVGGLVVFVLLMALMFQCVFSIAEPAKAVMEAGQARAAGVVHASLDEGPLRSLLVDGVIAGVGGVLVFLPQIFTLFFFIALLEDCGYMARAAYLMDRLMSRIGLSGKSFIPLLSSFACAIPGIMAARVIENRRDRLVTILVAPLMSCSARLPVFALLVSAFIPEKYLLGRWLGLQGLTMFAMYAIGVLSAIGVALLLKKTLLKGSTPPFVMELPSYKLPGLGLVLMRMWDRGWAFVRRAATLIFAISILVWAAAYYPRRPTDIAPELLQQRQDLMHEIAGAQAAADQAPGTTDEPVALEQRDLPTLEATLHTVENQIEGEYLRHSYLGRFGRLMEPAVRPIGWDWRIGCAVIASFPAREVVVMSLGVIYNLGTDEEELQQSLGQTLKSATWDGTRRPVFNIPVALSLMVFFALCAQCASTLVVIRRETNSWRWPIFTFAYMTGLAYVAALVTYQIGIRIGS